MELFDRPQEKEEVLEIPTRPEPVIVTKKYATEFGHDRAVEKFLYAFAEQPLIISRDRAAALMAERRDTRSPELLDLEGREKTGEELSMISLANELSNDVRKEAGAEPFDIPERNIHILSPEMYELIENRPSRGNFDAYDQATFIKDVQSHRIASFYVLAHEIRHAKEFVSLEEAPDDDEDLDYKPSRSGISVYSSLKNLAEKHYLDRRFIGLNEAIQAEWDLRTIHSAYEHEMFAGEAEWMRTDEAKSTIRGISQRMGIPEEYVYYVSQSDHKCDVLGYWQQHKVLKYILETLAEDRTEEDVFAQFTRAQYGSALSGLLALTRTIEISFGKGSFEVLGELDDERNCDKVLARLTELREKERARKKTERPV